MWSHSSRGWGRSHFPISRSRRCRGRSVRAGRGTWLVHMLREMMRERSATNKPDERFNAAMRQIFQEHRGSAISNKDVEQIFEQHLPAALRYEGHASLDWFFDGWVNGSAVPGF